MDQIIIRGLLVRGIVGINPDERTKKQDILIDATLWADTRRAAATDDIEDAVNYRTITKAMIDHLEQGAPMLVERLAAELVGICFDADPGVRPFLERSSNSLTVVKPGALRFAESVGVTIRRSRGEV